MKKVIIIGSGAQANVISNVLAKDDDISEIVLTDIDLKRAQETARISGSSKIKAEKIDAASVDEMTKRMQKGGFDLVVNATIPMFVRQVMQAAYSARTNYLDMASNEIYPKEDVPIEQLEYARQWEEAGLKCLTGGGGDPGLTNIMAKSAVNELDEIDKIMIKDYGVVDCDEPVALWSMRTYLEDCYLPTTIWEDGKPKQVAPFTGKEAYDFPAPLNLTGTVYYHDHEECVTIPLFCGKPVKYCDFKIGEPGSEMWNFLITGLGMMDPEPIDFNGCKVSPREMLFKKIPETATPERQMELYESGRLSSHLMLTCDVVGKKDGKTVHHKFWTDSPTGAEANDKIKGTNDVSWMTSIPASIFCLMLLKGQVKHTGVFPPEVFDREEQQIFYQGIRDWGITVYQQTKAVKVDAKNANEILKASEGCDLIVNGLPPDFNLNLMEAALHNKMHYQDMASGPVADTDFISAVKRQLAMDEKFKQSGLSALINTGSAPGLVSVLARNSADKMDRVDRIDIFVYDAIWTNKFIPFWWSPETAFGDMAAKPVNFVNGEFEIVEPYNDPVMIDFRGIGPRRLVDHEHEEPVTFGLNSEKVFKGCRNVGFKYGGPALELSESFYKMGLLSMRLVEVGGVKVTPLDLVCKLTPPAPSDPESIKAALGDGMATEEGAAVVRVDGARGGKQVRIDNYINAPGLVESFEKHGTTHESFLTGQPAFLFTKCFVHDKIDIKGVFAPEILDIETRDYYLLEGTKLGITVDEIVKTRLF